MKAIKILSGILVISLAAACNFANNKHPYGLDTVDKDTKGSEHEDTTGHHKKMAPGADGSESYNYGDSIVK